MINKFKKIFLMMLLGLPAFTQAIDVNTIVQPQLSNQLYVKPIIRDPFSPSKLMYEVVGVQSGSSAGAFGFVPNLKTVKIPKMKLKGFVNNSEGKKIALLEIDGSGTHMVHEGDQINIDPSQPRQAIRISKISRNSVTVETGTLGSIRILR